MIIKDEKKGVSYDVEDYIFGNFEGKAVEGVDRYEFSDLSSGISPVHTPEHQKVIKLERNHTEGTAFNLSEIVDKHRGMLDQRESEKEARIQEEVERRIAAIQEEAFTRGIEEGRANGREEVILQMNSEVSAKLEALDDMINRVLSTEEEIYKTQKDQMYKMLRTLTKWIILRELKDDGTYIERLLEKLFEELQTRSNVLIQVNEGQFDQMQEIVEQMKVRFSEMKNVRIEQDFDISNNGISLESENGIIRGTLEEQFKSIDSLFESVGLEEEV